MAIPAATITLAAIIRPVEKGWLGAGFRGALRLWTDERLDERRSRILQAGWHLWHLYSRQGQGKGQVVLWHSIEACELGMDLPLASGAGIEAAALLLRMSSDPVWY